MGILAVHITTAERREKPVNEVALGHLGHPGQIGVGWVPQNDVTMEAVRADGYFPTPPVNHLNHTLVVNAQASGGSNPNPDVGGLYGTRTRCV